MKTITPVDSIEIPFEFVELASHWHDGQDSLLYAIASTGNLTLGTIRPLDCETDEEWYLSLWDSLDCELSRLLKQIERRKDEFDDFDQLLEFQRFAESTSDQLRRDHDLWE
jgi:hypothetical protein